MGAPEGNQFWKLRSKHGRDKIFESPEILWEACTEYFEATDARKWWKTEFHGKDVEECKVPTDTPYTLTGLWVFLDIVKSTWYQYKEHKDFSTIVTRVEQIIYTQKFEGAAVGAYNSNIIARDLGLKDQQDITTGDKPITPEIIINHMNTGVDLKNDEADVDGEQGA